MYKLKLHKVGGHVYFCTFNVVGFKYIFIAKDYFQIIIDNLNFYRKSKNFKLIAYCIMPNHLHLIIWPQGQHDPDSIMKNLKEFTAKQIINQLKKDKKFHLLKFFSEAGKKCGQKYKVWDESYWPENIYSDKFLEQKVDYIHYNPVRWKLCKNPEEYLYSSARNYYLNDNSIIKIDLIE